jgi:hypothetical protein
MPDEYPSNFIAIIEGNARGADTMAGVYATTWGLGLEVYPANWKKYNKAAGPIRNQQMLDEGKPDLVLAFHDNIDKSKGTKDMVARAEKAGIEVRIITHGGK